MSRQINLNVLNGLVLSFNEDIINAFIKNSNFHYKEIKGSGATIEELKALNFLFAPIIDELTFNQKNGYYLGLIKNMGFREEFDVLRFGEESILNIELKSDLPKKGLEAVKDQLIRHQFYLNTLNKRVYLFSYIKSKDRLYMLENEDLLEVSKYELISKIEDNYINSQSFHDLDLDDLIISPYTEPVKFKRNKYFLTDEQKQVRNKILTTKSKRIGLVGGPGTGKSLLLNSCAKRFQKDYNKRTLIYFCSLMELQEANFISDTLGIKVVPIKYFKESSLEEYDIIFFDEAHRLWECYFTILKKYPNKKMIFSVDHNQTLHQREVEFNLEKKLKESKKVEIFELKYRIRTNPEISSFIQKIFNLSATGVQPYDYDCVKIQYFNNLEEAEVYLSECSVKSTVIEFTEYITQSYGTLKMPNILSDSKYTHAVIGREYDDVTIPMGPEYYYTQDNKLSYRSNEYYPYIVLSMLFQSLTRVKKSLTIVVYNNPELYLNLTNIKNWKREK